MKRITLIALLLIAGFAAKAQNYYDFTAEQETYADLDGATSMTNGEVWDLDYFGEFEMPFEFSIAGQTVDRFAFDDDYFVFLAPGVDYFESETGEGIFYISPTSLYVQDREYSTGIPASDVTYSIEGEAGNRILKLELKNAGLENAEDLELDENHFYLSLQVWIYEADNAMEFRFGDNNITDLDAVTMGEGLMVGFGDDNHADIVIGDPSAPSYGEYTLDNFPFDNHTLSSYPESGTVYRFAPAGVNALPGVAANKLQLYPNPATAVLNISTDGFTNPAYSITDVTGKVVMKNTLASSAVSQVNVEALAPGVYFMNISNQHVKFIKK